MFSELTAETPVAYSLPERAINLPSYHDMTDDDQRRVIEVLRTLVLKRTGL
jgi:perosamine synthetase